MKSFQTALLFGIVALAVAACNNVETVEERPLEYLESTIPPCVEVAGSSQDPCPRIGIRNLAGNAHSVEYREVPNYWDLYQGDGRAEVFIPHLVLRGTYRPKTSRCDMYKTEFPAFADFSLPGEYMSALCFTDVRVNDYLVGTGPPELTVISHASPFIYDPSDHSAYLRGLRVDVAGTFEGREVVMFLIPSVTTLLEAWRAIEVWPVHRNGDDITVVAPFKKVLEQHGLYDPSSTDGTYYRDLTPQELALLEVPLDEFEKTIAAAAVRRATATGGRILIGDDWPMLITDANLLRPYYEGPGVGIVYETDAPAKPPPAPGGE